MTEPRLVRPEPAGGGRLQCPECGASYPQGPSACPICLGLGAPATGSNAPGEDRVLAEPGEPDPRE